MIKTNLIILVVSIAISTFSFAQESNPESQRRGWNVPRSEREHYGFAQERVKVEVNNDVEGKSSWMQRGPRGLRGPMMMRRGMVMNHMCDCNCNKKLNKRGEVGKKHGNRGERKHRKTFENKND